MKRTALSLAVLLSLFTVAAARPVAQRHGEGAAVFHLVETTVRDIQLALQTGLITSEQLVHMYLARIAAYDDHGPAVNAFLHVNDQAIEQARSLDAARHPGRARSPLYGVPVALKPGYPSISVPGGFVTRH